MKKLFLLPVLALGVLMLGCKGTGKRKAPLSESAVMVCDASFENVMQQEIEVFEYVYPYSSIIPYYIDEQACVDSIVSGSVRLAILTHDLTKDQKAYLKEKKRIVKTKQVAVDAVAVIVNPANPVENLTVKDLREILTGQINQWNDVYPSSLGKIQVVFDHSGSSVTSYMRDSVLHGEPFADNVYSANSMKAVFETVKERKDAIGIVGVSWISSDLKTTDMTTEERVQTLEADDSTTTVFTKEVKVLGITSPDSPIAYKPYQAYIFDGSYPLHRSIYMINTGAGGSLPNRFFSFVTSFRGQKLMMSSGVLPATVHRRMVAVE